MINLFKRLNVKITTYNMWEFMDQVFGMELKEELECSQSQETIENVTGADCLQDSENELVITGDQVECEP